MTLLTVLFGKLPATQWLREYNAQTLGSDVLAASIVTLMMIPQALAYALLAGLPPETGLYASMLPLIGYALFGSSRTLSVGPMAVISLMTAAALARLDPASGLTHAQAASVLALESGLMLAALGMLRFGFIANFLSHPVVAGFISASGILILLSQVKHLLGISSSGDTVPALLLTLFAGAGHTNLRTLLLGLITLCYLLWARTLLPRILKRIDTPAFFNSLCVKTAPIVVVVLATTLAWLLQLDQYGIALVGNIPARLPDLQLPPLEAGIFYALAPSALLISLIGFVESVSIGKILGARRQQKVIPDSELLGLGVANIAAAFSGGFPVTGGFARSLVNFDVGARTPAASIFTAAGMLLAMLLLAPLLAWLPNATLAATIIVAVLGLIDFSILRLTWNYSKKDFIAVLATIAVTLLWGVELGVSCGVVVSLLLHLYKTSRPHIAEVGEIAHTGHFRNIKRHKVETHPSILSLRVDESLYFANASYIEDEIFRTLKTRQGIHNVILLCAAINEIDLSALEVLFTINKRLMAMQTGFHLSEVKGPVMDALQKTDFLQQLNGQVFLSHSDAVHALLERELQTHRVHPEYQDFQI